MLSPVVEFLRSRYRPLHCDCCDHNFEVASVTSKESEKHRCERFVRNWLESLKRVGPKRTAKPRDGSEEKAEKRRRFWRLFCLERFRWRRIQRLHSESVTMHSEPTKDISSGSPNANVYHALTSILTCMISSDTLLEAHPDPPMRCFLVNLARDFDTHGHFPSSFFTLPPSAAYLDASSSLSYASSWLQSSLILIRDSCTTAIYTGPVELQPPFVLLETDLELARARAAWLQQCYPQEKIVIATLDLKALKDERFVVTAEHAFRMLRVSSREVDLKQKLLLWVKFGRGEDVARVLRDTVLSVMEWKAERRRDGLSDVKKGGEHVGQGEAIEEDVGSEIGRHGLRKQSRDKNSKVTSCDVLEESRKKWSAVGGNAIQRRGTCRF